MQISLTLLISGLVLFSLAGGVFYVAYPIWSAIRVSKVIQKNAVPYEQHPAQATMRILVVGDSTAVGTGAVNPKESTAGRLGAEYPNADITNIGVNGLTLEDLTPRLTALQDASYDLVLIQIGANDIVGMTPNGKIEKELSEVLDSAGKMSPNVVVLTAGNVGLSPVFRFPLSWLITQKTRTVREVFIRTIAAHLGVRYVDLFKELADEPFNTDIPKYYAPDLFHPTGDGYALWYEKIRMALR